MATVEINGAAHACETGLQLSDVLALWGEVRFPCGGHGRCGKCRVTVKGAVSPVTQEERQLLSSQELAEGVRLACRTYLKGDCQITTEAVAKAYVLGSSAPLSAAHPLCKAYGVAVDVGTTTLAANLYASDGSLLAQAACVNPQATWGSDVISRIGAALEGHARALAQKVRQGIDGLLKELASQAGIPVEAVDAMVITGNTAMLYLLTQTDPDCLSHGPFQADRLFGEWLTGAQLELSCPQAQVYLPRCFGAFVGADIATALLSSGITQEKGTRLLGDIGTNGEIALWDRGELLCCSTAAGPAFEGAGLSMGMPSLDGAIDHVAVEDGVLKAHVLGEGKAVGICGSGVVDALAGLLELEQMDEKKGLETIRRLRQLIETWQLEKLMPNQTLKFFYQSAVFFCCHGKREEALTWLDAFVQGSMGLCRDDLKLAGDDYFTLVEEWFEQSALGTAPPRSPRLIPENILQALKAPQLASLSDSPRFIFWIEQMEKILKRRSI